MSSRSGGFKRSKTTGEFIRDKLSEEEDYTFNIYKKFKKEMSKRYKPGSYQNFQHFFWALRKLEIIEATKHSMATKKLKDGSLLEYPQLKSRTYYRIVEGREDDPAWRNPWKALKEL